MGEWPTTGADPNRLSDTPTDEIPVVRDQLWTPFRAPAMAYRERVPAPRSRWAEMLATVRRYARLPVLAAIYLGAVVALSLIVARVVHTPGKGPSAAGTRQEQEHNGLRPHPLAQHHRSGARKRPAIRPVGPSFRRRRCHRSGHHRCQASLCPHRLLPVRLRRRRLRPLRRRLRPLRRRLRPLHPRLRPLHPRLRPLHPRRNGRNRLRTSGLGGGRLEGTDLYTCPNC